MKKSDGSADGWADGGTNKLVLLKHRKEQGRRKEEEGRIYREERLEGAKRMKEMEKRNGKKWKRCLRTHR